MCLVYKDTKERIAIENQDSLLMSFANERIRPDAGEFGCGERSDKGAKGRKAASGTSFICCIADVYLFW